ncbi:MAG TPA: MerR family transcriptional regulator [Longimicrobium sp.]|jgi:DNA-binding transcriptional MerR regulator
MKASGWKVGELARRTGLTVRTLHHYDEVGLLRPGRRTPAGHRLYGDDEVERLHRIQSLRRLGWGLDEIRGMLDDPRFSPAHVVELHLERVREQIRLQQRLCERLEEIASRLRAAETVSADELIQTIEAMTMFEKYYTPEQMEELRQRREQVGEERIREVEAEWPRLMDEVRAEMERGTDPADERVQALARRWMGLVQEFTGGNPGIERSLGNVYREESTVHGMDVAGMRPLMEYVQRAMAAGRG